MSENTQPPARDVSPKPAVDTAPLDFSDLPIDPDIDDGGAAFRRPTSLFPRLAPDVVAAVFAGGIFGGLARYAIGKAAPSPDNAFPWDVFGINLGGAFALALLLVLAIEVFPANRYLRPGLGTGFLGAFTTFSSLANATDHLLAHGHAGLAIAYPVGSLVGGLLAAILGLTCGRIVGKQRIRGHNEETATGASA
ncbi:MAG: fluoride efflux transporter FluC [Acidothermaceae bacterium]